MDDPDKIARMLGTLRGNTISGTTYDSVYDNPEYVGELWRQYTKQYQGVTDGPSFLEFLVAQGM